MRLLCTLVKRIDGVSNMIVDEEIGRSMVHEK